MVFKFFYCIQHQVMVKGNNWRELNILDILDI